MLTVGTSICSAGEISSESGFVDGGAAAEPLRVVYADHSRLVYHGVVAGDVAIILMAAFELVCGGLRSSNL